MAALLRFAPSPTGALHLGGLRTALLNHLYAKRLGGKWILRIEDTDATRTVSGAVEGIRAALSWAGLEYDYGPGKHGSHAPYYQSERLDLYRLYAKKLLDSGHAYRCFCSPDKLAATREKLARSGSNSTYDKTCLHLPDEETARRVRAGDKFIVRLNDGKRPKRLPPTDIVFGLLSDSHASLPTDPVLLKSDNFPTYHLASVVDDHEMGITHVFRGEEWLPSFPLHLDLYASLSLKPPQYAHLPLLLNPNGTKMSKRNGDVQVADFIRTGWEPSAILNWLALAGWGVNHAAQSDSTVEPSHNKQAPDSTTVMTLPELTAQFDPASVTHRRNILDPIKLQVLNKYHLQLLWSTPDGLESLARRVQGLVKEAFPSSQYTTIEYLKRVIVALESRIINVHDIPRLAPFLFVEPDLSSEEAVSLAKEVPSPKIYVQPTFQRSFLSRWNATLNSASISEQITQALHARLSQCPLSKWDTFDIAGVLHEVKGAAGVQPKVFMTTLRHAITGMKTGPGVADIIKALGKERTIARLKSGSPRKA